MFKKLLAFILLIGNSATFLHGQTWQETIFKAKNFNELLRVLNAQNAVQSGQIQLNTPDIAEKGTLVEITALSQIANTQAIYLFVDKNPNALAAVYEFSANAQPYVRTQLKFAQTSRIVALIRTIDQKFFYATRDVSITIGGCGILETEIQPPGSMRMRARMQGRDEVDYLSLVIHPMESGQRKDNVGKLIPPYFIQHYSVTAQGKPLVTAQWGTAVSQNPLVGLRFKGLAKGEKLHTHWLDNKGERRQQEVVVQ